MCKSTRRPWSDLLCKDDAGTPVCSKRRMNLDSLAIPTPFLAGAIVFLVSAGPCAGTPASRDDPAPENTPVAAVFPVAVRGTLLVHNDGTGRRFFASGLVDNRPASGNQLSRYKHDDMREQIATHARIGATVMRWNTFLKGNDLVRDDKGMVTGIVPGGMDAIMDGLDLAAEHGVLLQLTLSTGHFLQYGWGGPDRDGNRRRVTCNRRMFTEEKALQAYLDNVISPIAKRVGTHQGLLGYLIVNEAHAMIHPAEIGNGGWTDQHVSLAHMRRFINRVGGTIKNESPGALVTVSSIAKLMDRWEDADLIKAGGHRFGTIDWHQIQFYPRNHLRAWSPFAQQVDVLRADWNASAKPVVCGEFPVEGMPDKPYKDVKKHPGDPFDLKQAYRRLWNNGYSGGFTWSYNVYAGMDPGAQAAVEAAYTHLRTASQPLPAPGGD